MIKRDMIRLLATLSLLFAGGLLLLSLLNIRSWFYYGGPKWWPPLMLGAIYWGVLGAGMAYRGKWAIGLFAVSTGLIGLCLIIGPIVEAIRTASGWALLSVPLGAALFIPVVMAVSCWRDLK
jgi:hypothetical protein